MSNALWSRAAIIAVGSELLTPTRVDTNSLSMTRVLNDAGLHVRHKCVVGDDRDELATAFAYALTRSDVVVLSGGLGPTDDDLTREVVAGALQRQLREDAAIVADIRARFERRRMTMPDINRRQALVPEGATVLPNDRGTAPGLWLTHGTQGVLLVPGPPREMQPMFERAVTDWVRPRAGAVALRRRVVKIAGRSESSVEETVQPLYGAWRDGVPAVEATILASLGQIELHLSARGSDTHALDDRLTCAVQDVERVLAADVFTHDDLLLEAAVGVQLREKGWRVVLAESCTGGRIAARLTAVAGASDYVDRAVVTYSNAAKTQLAGVSPELILAHGAVSEPVAAAMAEGLRQTANADVGVGVTGVAGPGGGTVSKPVGMVCIAVATRNTAVARTFNFPGERTAVQSFATTAALDMLRRTLHGISVDTDWNRRAAVLETSPTERS